MVVTQPQSTRVEEPTLLCNQAAKRVTRGVKRITVAKRITTQGRRKRMNRCKSDGNCQRAKEDQSRVEDWPASTAQLREPS